MKLSRLPSTTQQHAPEAKARAQQALAHQVRRVEALEAVATDRERSLLQEMLEIQPAAIGPFDGGELILDNARELASQLTQLGDDAGHLLKRQVPAWTPRVNDDA